MTRKRLALAALATLALVAAGCGGKKAAQTTTQATTHELTVTATVPSTAAAPVRLRVYLLRDGKVAPVAREVPGTTAVAHAALVALGQGPTDDERSAGLSTALPPAPSYTVVLQGDVLRVGGASGLDARARAQLVYTLTQFPSVRAVVIGGRRLRRGDFEDETPAILVESPLPGETVTSPLRVTGTANTFEATFTLELFIGKRKLADEVVTATSGSGTRGTFAATVAFAGRGAGRLVAFEPSAENGKPLHTVEIPLALG